MQRFSRKRQAILDCLRSTDTHPTADWIYAQLRPSYPDLSLGTVYRNLTKMKENGRIVSVGVLDGHEHFDGNVLPHAHFICSGCHAILDAGEVPDFSGQLAAEKLADCTVSGVELYYHGLCPDCREAENE